MKLYGTKINSFCGVLLRQSLPTDKQYFIAPLQGNKKELIVLSESHELKTFNITPLNRNKSFNAELKIYNANKFKAIYERKEKDFNVIQS